MITKIKAFDYRNVTLHEGKWKNQFINAKEVLLSIPNDSLLYGFRLRAGKHATGVSLDGWYKDGGSNFGQILTALSKMYAITKDSLIYEKLLRLVSEWGECLDMDGFGLFPANHNDTYLFEKLIGGLIDASLYAGIEKAISYAVRYADYTIRNMPRDFLRDGLHHEDMLRRYIIEWYTMPEQMYRLYDVTGNKRYLDFAEELTYHAYWERLSSIKNFEYGATGMKPRHAYSHINTLSSAAKSYLITGNTKWLEAAKNGYCYIYENETYVTGGYGPVEILFGKEGYLGDSVKSPYDENGYRNMEKYPKFCDRSSAYDHFEISCGCHGVFKLGNYLLQITNNPYYGHWVEKLLYNGMGAQLPLTKEGYVMYYGNYALSGAFKSVRDNRLRSDYSNYRWQCCTGTYIQNVCEYYNMLYYYDDNSLYVNQYLPSSVTWKKGKPEEMILEHISENPFKEELRFQVVKAGNCEMSICFRISEWCNADATITCEGKTEKAVQEDWHRIYRKWKAGDEIILHFPRRLELHNIDSKNPEIKALTWGPLVLAGTDLAWLQGDCSSPEKWIHCVDKENVIFKTKPGHDRGYDHLERTFKPYADFKEMEWYYLYVRILNNFSNI